MAVTGPRWRRVSGTRRLGCRVPLGRRLGRDLSTNYGGAGLVFDALLATFSDVTRPFWNFSLELLIRYAYAASRGEL